MHALLYLSIGALAIVAFGWRLLLAVRGPSSPAKWAVAVAIACAAAGFEAAVPQTYSWIGRTSGIPNLATLIVYSSIATATLAQLVWTAYLVAPGEEHDAGRGARTVMAINVAVVITMVALFFAAPVHDEIHATDFDDHYAKSPLVDVYLGLYLCVYTIALLRIVALCRSWLPHVREQLWLRRGLLLLVFGSSIAVGYSIGKVVAVTCSWLGIAAHRLNTDIAPAFASLGAAIMLIGYLCPSAIPQSLSAVHRVLALPRLRPLQADLRASIPEIAGTAPVPRGIGRDRLYRTVIEIRDALLILQPHASQAVTERAEQLAEELAVPAEKRAATVEAARIAAALDSYRTGATPADLGNRFRGPEQPSFAGELDWLIAVAIAYRSSPVIPAILVPN